MASHYFHCLTFFRASHCHRQLKTCWSEHCPKRTLLTPAAACTDRPLSAWMYQKLCEGSEKSNVFILLNNFYTCYYSFIHRSLEWNTVCYLVKILCNTVHRKGWKFRTISCSCFVTSKRKMLGVVPLRTSKTTTTTNTKIKELKSCLKAHIMFSI